MSHYSQIDIDLAAIGVSFSMDRSLIRADVVPEDAILAALRVLNGRPDYGALVGAWLRKFGRLLDPVQLRQSAKPGEDDLIAAIIDLAANPPVVAGYPRLGPRPDKDSSLSPADYLRKFMNSPVALLYDRKIGAYDSVVANNGILRQRAGKVG